MNKSKESASNPLTNLQSRRIYNELIDNFSSDNNIGICYLDANYLKFINDNYGHAAEDYLLITIANTIKKVFRIADIFHLGGDEFLVISCNINYNIWEEKINKLKELLSLAKQDIIDKYNIKDEFFCGDLACMGIIYKEKITNSQELVKLIEIADQKLMDEKTIIHEKFGDSRRK